MKVMTIVGTRPEIIKLSEVMKELDQYVEHTIVHTGQNYDYELNEIFFEDLGLRKPDFFLNVSGKNLGETIGNVISKSFEILTSVNGTKSMMIFQENAVKEGRVPEGAVNDMIIKEDEE